MKKLTLLAAAASCAVLAGCSSLITESMGVKIMMHMAISTDLTMYLATVKTVNKTKGAMRNACLSGDAAKCEQMINDNSKTITGPMAREWENLILEGGIELDKRHRKTFENMGK